VVPVEIEVNDAGVGPPIVQPVQNAGPGEAQAVENVTVVPSAPAYVSVQGTVAVLPALTVNVSGHVIVPAPLTAANAGVAIMGMTENMLATSSAPIDSLCSFIGVS